MTGLEVGRPRRWWRWYCRWPVLVPLVVVALAVWWRWPEAGEAPPPVVDIASTAPRFGTLGELVGASDLIVAGTVTASSEGRVITDPANPGAGIRTVLVEITVEQVLAGVAPDPLIIEHEATLLDSTPITVDGVPAPVPSEQGLFFLVDGGGGGGGGPLPYHAVVGPQGRYRLTASELSPVSGDVLSSEIASLDLADLAAQLNGL